MSMIRVALNIYGQFSRGNNEHDLKRINDLRTDCECFNRLRGEIACEGGEEVWCREVRKHANKKPTAKMPIHEITSSSRC